MDISYTEYEAVVQNIGGSKTRCRVHVKNEALEIQGQERITQYSSSKLKKVF